MSQSNLAKTTHSQRSEVWAYFKQCDGDPNKVRCNLCSLELSCDRGSTVSILSNHIKYKHSIGLKNNTSSNDDSNHFDGLNHKLHSSTNMTQIKLRSSINNHNHNNNNSNSNSKSNTSTTTTKTKTNQRQNSDYIDYNDYSVTSMKPSPSSSLSKNLISRLNQLSSPVTRKLKFWNKKSFQVNQYDPSFKVIYLGNLGMQLWSKDESCLDKPLSTLWNNYLVNMKTEIVMRLTICNSGLKAITRQHGLTQYWSNRLVYCCSHKNYPRIFSWVYRHEGKKMRQELRCHAVLCPSPEKAAKMVTMLNQRLACALQEFRREKKSRSGLSLVSNTPCSQQTLQPRTIPLRRQILAKGSANFRPPLERSKSAPKLTSIREEDHIDEEDEEEEQEEEQDGVVEEEDEEDASQDEYEFEESFGDRDDINEEDSDYEELNKNGEDEEDEDSAHKIESNSLTTTVHEETSNSSACATGDNSYDNNRQQHGQPINQDKRLGNQNVNGLPVEKNSFNRLSSTDAHKLATDYLRTKETSEISLSKDKKLSHNNQINQLIQSSANTITSSSFKDQMVVDNHGTNSEEDSNSLTILEAKNNNTDSNKKEPQLAGQADDVPTQEIILSWSNLVIK